MTKIEQPQDEELRALCHMAGVEVLDDTIYGKYLLRRRYYKPSGEPWAVEMALPYSATRQVWEQCLARLLDYAVQASQPPSP